MEAVPSFGLDIREKEFKLRDDVTYVNHASYGIVPTAIKKAHQCIREEAETFPDIWIRKNRKIRQNKARHCIADFLKADPDDVVFIENVTAGLNCILKSLRLGKDDTILYSDQTYRSMQNACQATREWVHTEDLGIHVKSLALKFPIKHEDEVVDMYREIFRNNKNVKVAVIEHISCPSAIRMPIEKLVPLCKEFGVMCVVDGAHGPGQFNLNIRELDPDFYLGNLYKWLYTPWNCGIMYVSKKHQNWIRPLITALVYTKTFQEDFSDQGVRDYSAFCTVPAAIQFYNYVGGHEKITSYTDELLNEAVELMTSSWGTEKLQVPKSMEAPNIRMVRLPVSNVLGIKIKNLDDSDRALTEVTEKFKIGTAITCCDDKVYIRLSANIYNTKEDFVKLNEFVMKHILTNAND